MPTYPCALLFGLWQMELSAVTCLPVCKAFEEDVFATEGVRRVPGVRASWNDLILATGRVGCSQGIMLTNLGVKETLFLRGSWVCSGGRTWYRRRLPRGSGHVSTFGQGQVAAMQEPAPRRHAARW